jgi:hypothetical protein
MAACATVWRALQHCQLADRTSQPHNDAFTPIYPVVATPLDNVSEMTVDDRNTASVAASTTLDAEDASAWNPTIDGDSVALHSPLAEDDSEADGALVLCPCGDVLTPKEATADIGSALDELMDSHFSIGVAVNPRLVTETDRRRLDRSRVYFALGRLKGALSNKRFERTRGDEAYVTWLETNYNTHGCNCDTRFCNDFPCCKDAQ